MQSAHDLPEHPKIQKRVKPYDKAVRRTLCLAEKTIVRVVDMSRAGSSSFQLEWRDYLYRRFQDETRDWKRDTIRAALEQNVQYYTSLASFQIRVGIGQCLHCSHAPCVFLDVPDDQIKTIKKLVLLFRPRLAILYLRNEHGYYLMDDK